MAIPVQPNLPGAPGIDQASFGPGFTRDILSQDSEGEVVVSISKLGFSQFHQFSKLRPEPSGIPLHIQELAVVLETTIPLSSWMILT